MRWVIALVTALVVVWGPAPALASFPGVNGKIAYAGAGSNEFGIYSVEPAGADQRLIVAQADGPSWSPDGQRLAVRGVPGIETVNSDGTGRTTLTTNTSHTFDGNPDWSPDGSRIAFDRFFAFMTAPVSQIFTVAAADGSGEEPFPTGTLFPAWSPDGQQLAFVYETVTIETDEEGNDVEILDRDIQTAKLDGSARKPITSGPDQDFAPDWSPDGSQIAFARRDGGLYIVNADATGLRFLTEGRSPSWSPDGTRIVFARGAFRQSEIYTIAVDGTDERRVTSTDDGIYGEEPDWQQLPGPRRADFKNASRFCAAERDFLGEQAFRERYGGGANAHGKCVSSS